MRRGRTGAMCLLDSLAGMQGQGTRPERLALTAAARNRQVEGSPVATWDLARIEEAGGPRSYHLRVGQLMTTDLFTVGEHYLVDLVAYVMTWRHIRHVPVEDAQHRLVGIVTHRALLRLIGESLSMGQSSSIPVERIMEREVVTVTSETTVLAAMRQMKEHRVSGLPVVDGDGRLVGMITERDLMHFAGQLLEQALAGEPVDPAALATVGAPPAQAEEMEAAESATGEREAVAEERGAEAPTSFGPGGADS